jgi:hypothetical protein
MDRRDIKPPHDPMREKEREREAASFLSVPL